MFTTRIALEPDAVLTPRQLHELARLAHTRKPGPETRSRLAQMLGNLGAHEEIITLLHGQPDLGGADAVLLASALMQRTGRSRFSQALSVIEQALAQTGDGRMRSVLLTQAGRIRNGMKARDEAYAALSEALRLDPYNREACMRRATLDLEAGDSEAVLALVEQLGALGVRHGYVLALKTLALAQMGEIAAAHRVSPMELTDQIEVMPPGDWPDIAAFNAALAQELIQHPAFTRQNFGTDRNARFGISSPLGRGTPLLHLLMTQIADALTGPLNQYAQTAHPWSNMRPREATLHCSCVVAEAGDFDSWHVHPGGWLNGVYYVRIPPAIAEGQDEAGCVAFGLPEDLAGPEAAAAYGDRVLRPREGTMVLFPSHFYHRTFAHNLPEQRIAITFELRPVPSSSTDQAV